MLLLYFGSCTVGLPAVVTFAQLATLKTRDGFSYAEACKTLENMGCDVVGLNCSSGPDVMTHLMKDVRRACKGPLAALPVPYRYSTFTQRMSYCIRTLFSF